MSRIGVSQIEIVVAIACGLIALLWLAVSYLRQRRPRYRRGRFLSANEKAFLRALDEAVAGRFRVFAQVRLADLVDIDASVGERRRFAAMRRVFGKSVDFVLCDVTTLEPRAVVEVDDRTHLLSQRKDRDAFVNTVFSEIGLPLLRVAAARSYSAPAIRKLLMEAGVEIGMRRSGSRAMEAS